MEADSSSGGGDLQTGESFLESYSWSGAHRLKSARRLLSHAGLNMDMKSHQGCSYG